MCGAADTFATCLEMVRKDEWTASTEEFLRR